LARFGPTFELGWCGQRLSVRRHSFVTAAEFPWPAGQGRWSQD
jgi:hypothetical protein